MIFKTVGTILNKNTQSKIWWTKLGIALVLSNIFFFVLFKPTAVRSVEPRIQPGWVELQIRADLLTPFQADKKVLLVNRNFRCQVEAVLKESADPEGRMTVLIRETDASLLFRHEHWEILPFMKTLSFAPISRGESYEIRY